MLDMQHHMHLGLYSNIEVGFYRGNENIMRAMSSPRVVTDPLD